jgi:alpha/beta superfamily hydrolase
MALKGQLLERMVVLPVGGRCLDGIFLRGDGPGLLIASPLASEGGSMVHPVCCELAYAASFAGAASLRLDYRGVGASEGERSDDLSQAAADLREGVDFLVESTRTEGVVVAGLYTGGWAALTLAKADPRVELVLLVCPAAGAPPLAYGELGVPVVVVCGDEDPTFDRPAETERVDAAKNARLHVIPGVGRQFREGLAKLARLVPPLLGRDVRDV